MEIFPSSSTQRSAQSTLLLACSVFEYICRYMHIICLWVLYSTCFRLLAGSVLQEMTKPPSPLPPPPSHHHPPVPKGSSTQINWKKEECTVVLPLHLSGRESRRGRTHGPYRGTISLHLSQTVSSLMGWNIAHKIHLPLYHLCVLAYWCPSRYQFPEAYAVAFCLILPSSHQSALSNHLADYAFKPNSTLKEIIPLYIVNQLMKMKDYQVTKFACKKFQNECAAQRTWKLNERESTHCIWRKYWERKKVRCNLLITRALSYSNGAVDVFGGWVWLVDSSCLLSCRGCVTSPIPFALSNYAIGLVNVAEDKMTTSTIPIKVHGAAHWSPTKQGSSVIW